MLITHMQDMQEVTQELHYENYRSEKLAKARLAGGSASSSSSASSASSRPPPPAAAAAAAPPQPPPPTLVRPQKDPKENLLQQKEEEIRRMREMMERLQAELEKEKHTPPATPARSQESL